MITSAPEQLDAVAEALKTAGTPSESQKLMFILESPMFVTGEAIAVRLVRLIEALEENDNVQSVHSNFDASEEVLASISG
ncbi:MAG: Transcriptional regulator [Chthoniobacter sp.]|nr:Transcriptional regulator [Chthoniobacter sp.]